MLLIDHYRFAYALSAISALNSAILYRDILPPVAWSYG
jgi:hypothetical protein